MTLSEMHGHLHSTWLKNITDDQTSFDMGMLEATNAAQNQCL